MKIKAILFVVLILGGFKLSYGQNGWNWPEDKKTAETKNALYTDALRNDNYSQAANHLQWLIINSPDLNPSIYINGAKIYEGLAEEAKDAAKKVVYQDSALAMYDLRIKYFNQEADVLDRKAYLAYKYYKDDADKYQDLLDMYAKTFELNGNNVLGINTIAYMDILRRYQLTKKESGMSDDEILEKYDLITTALEHQISKGKNVAQLESYRDKIDAMLSEIVTVDCNFIEQNLGPKFKANPSDLKTGKKIIALSLTGKCTDSPLFLEAAKAVHEQEPNYAMARVIALRSKMEDDYSTASKYFNDAVSLTEETDKKADIYLELADLAAKQGQKSKAREYALKAVSTDPSKKDAYTLIGHLYFRSYEDCKQGKNIVEDRSVFLAAYEMYQKAGNTSAMQNAKEQFPSAEEIFTYNMEVGQQIQVGCWIGETVTIQKR